MLAVDLGYLIQISAPALVIMVLGTKRKNGLFSILILLETSSCCFMPLALGSGNNMSVQEAYLESVQTGSRQDQMYQMLSY